MVSPALKLTFPVRHPIAQSSIPPFTIASIDKPNRLGYYCCRRYIEKAGFQLRIFANDHSPPHVHVVKAGGFAKVAIGSATDPPRLLETRSLKERDIVRAVRVVEREWRKLMLAWTNIHGKENTHG